MIERYTVFISQGECGKKAVCGRKNRPQNVVNLYKQHRVFRSKIKTLDLRNVKVEKYDHRENLE